MISYIINSFLFPGPPSAPTNVTASPGNASATVSWSAPSSVGGSSITGYTLTRATNSSFTAGVVQTTLGNVLTTTVTGLTNGVAYWWRVQARNLAGTGPTSVSVTATPVTTPSAPTNVTASPGPTSAVISWSPPLSNGGSGINQYRVTRATNSSFTAGVVTTTTGGGGSSITATGLTNGVTYWWRVAARNPAVGFGPESSSVTATPLPFVVEYLVVAGGGGGHVFGGGGGAGGYRSGSITLNLSTAYSIVIGAGGANCLSEASPPPTNGLNSVFSSITSIGGGRGGRTTGAGATGGSGGGAGGRSGVLGGSGTSGQGNSGGNGGANGAGGGGGGAGGVGTSGSAFSGGNGGSGLSSSITGSPILRGGGGGGNNVIANASAGLAGSGGGGRGATQNGVAGVSGQVNTGGGGGGGGTAASGSGGSGIVILKYPSNRIPTFSAGVTQTTSTSGGFKISTITATSTTSLTVTFS